MKADAGVVGRSLLWSFLNTGAAQALSLLVFLGTARFVSKEAFGIMAICLGIVEILKRVAVDSFSTLVTAKEGATDHDFNICFTLTVLMSVGVAILLFLVAGLLANLINSPQIVDALRIVSALLITMGLSRTHEAWLSRHFQFKPLALRSIISILLGGVIGIGLAVSGYGIWSLIGQQLAIGTSSLALLWLATPWRPHFVLQWKDVLAHIGYTRSVALAELWNYLSTEADVFFVSGFLGVRAAGIYNAAKRIMFAASQFLSIAVFRVAMPAFGAAASRSDHARMFLNGVGTASLICAPAFLGLAVLSPHVIRILLGPTWHEVAPVLSLLTISGYVMAIVQFNQIIFLTNERPHIYNRLSFFTTCANVIFFLFAAPYGVKALAFAFSLRVLLFAPVSTGIVLHFMGINARAYFGEVLPSLGAACAAAAMTYYLGSGLPPWSPLLLAALLGCMFTAIYAALIYVIDRGKVFRLFSIIRSIAFVR